MNVFVSAAGHDIEEGKKLGKGSEPARGALGHKDGTGQGSRRLGKNRKESVEVDLRVQGWLMWAGAVVFSTDRS